MPNSKSNPFIFVLMPFDHEFDEVYELGIKAACENTGAVCQRVDEQIFQENIMERVYDQIREADIVIAEMTGRNSNVFYETGFAHALNKQVILATRTAEDIPFDLKQYPHIIYGSKISELKKQLQDRIRWYISQPKDLVAEKINMESQSFLIRMTITCRMYHTNSKLWEISKFHFLNPAFS